MSCILYLNEEKMKKKSFFGSFYDLKIFRKFALKNFNFPALQLSVVRVLSRVANLALIATAEMLFNFREDFLIYNKWVLKS